MKTMKEEEKDTILKKKLDEIQVGDYTSSDIGNIILEAKHRRKKTILSFVSVFTFIVIVFITSVYFIKVNHGVNPDNSAKNSEENGTNSDYAYEDTVILEGIKVDYIDVSPLILIIKVNNILDSEIINGMPNTKVESEIINIVSGDYNNKLIRFDIMQCISTISDIKNNKNIVCKFNDEYDLNTKVRVVPNKKISKLPFPEVGKTYVVILGNDSEEKQIMYSSKYPFYEYDMEKNLVNIDGEWTPFLLKDN